jgi:hypothetical protein
MRHKAVFEEKDALPCSESHASAAHRDRLDRAGNGHKMAPDQSVNAQNKPYPINSVARFTASVIQCDLNYLFAFGTRGCS